MSELIHVPVMPDEVIRYLAPADGGLIVDATLGEAGHSALFLEASPRAHLLGLDADATMLERAAMRLAPYTGRYALRHVWFDEFFASYSELERPVAVLFDLGISMFHYRGSGRGFTFQGEERLDMRLNSAATLSAFDIVNSWEESRIADLIYQFGEERYSRRIAAAIVHARHSAAIETAHDLAEVVFTSVPVSYRHGRIHPATRTFQALRIAVNDELDRLRRVLDTAIDLLAIGGKLGVISFHSLEDRIVKHTFRGRAKDSNDASQSPMMNNGRVRVVTKRPLVPTEDECRRNPASRSAKFRVIEKIADGEVD